MELTPLVFRRVCFRRRIPGHSNCTERVGNDYVEHRVFEISRLDDETGLKLAGELDLHSAGELTQALTAFQEADEVWLDMTEITFIDSSGLSSILSFARSRNGNGRIVIVDPTSVVGRFSRSSGSMTEPPLRWSVTPR